MTITNEDAEKFLYREARLLDEGKLEEWLSLFSDDGVYWIPIVSDDDPDQEPSILYDDAKMLAKRVHQIVREPRLAQRPASRTVHLISNVEIQESDGVHDTVVLRCNLVIFELRPGSRDQYGLGVPRWLAGRCEYRLRNKDGWHIVSKKVLLLDRDSPIKNLTFIV